MNLLDRLVSFWSLRGTLSASAGSSHLAPFTVVGGVTLDESGAHFDGGQTSHLEIHPWGQADPTRPYAVSLVVVPTTADPSQIIVYAFAADSYPPVILGNMAWGIGQAFGGWGDFSHAGSFPPLAPRDVRVGVPTQLGINADPANNHWEFWIDGIEADHTDHPPVLLGNDYLVLGNANTNVLNPFTGTVRDVGIWDRMLAADEWAALADGWLPPKPHVITGSLTAVGTESLLTVQAVPSALTVEPSP